MKSFFETPGGPQVESLNKLTAGLNRRAAAMLFYQTCGRNSFFLSPSLLMLCACVLRLGCSCYVSVVSSAVLATRNFVKVEQSAPYEDILITRGPNM